MREQLMDRMIRIYGFEHEIVIAFCTMCEDYPQTEAYDNTLRVLVESHEEFPVLDEEEEEDSYEPDGSMLECGYDPYMGCYSDDC